MKKLIYSILFIVMIGCSNNKVVYWCGDHPCTNKKERESYFKKTMIVEIKELKKIKAKENSEIEKIQLVVFDQNRFKCQSSLLGMQSAIIEAYLYKNSSNERISLMIPYVIKNC